MFAPLKRLVGGGQSKGTSELEAENDVLRQILQKHDPQHFDPRVQQLLEQSCAHRAKLRQAMQTISQPAPEPSVPADEQPVQSLCRAEYQRGTWPPVEFGTKMRQTYFDLDSNFLNSASYGATPKPVQQARRLWDLEFQKNPVLWRVQGLPRRLREIERALSRCLKCDPNNLRLLTNANAATSCVLKSLPWQLGDVIFTFSIDYDATKNAVKWLQRTHGVRWEEMPMQLPLSNEDILKQTEEKLKELCKKNLKPALANFCHVTSKTAYIFPATELVALFHKYGIPVLVDGAQAAGHLDLNISRIGADWYVGTVHKWMYSNQGVAFIVVDPSKHAVTSPLVVSYFHGHGFGREFDYYGLQDFSTFCAVGEALEFVDNVCQGWENLRRKLHENTQECVKILNKHWGTEPCQLVTNSRGEVENHHGNMPIMPLPGGEDVDPSAAGKVMGFLLAKKEITAFLMSEKWRCKDGKVRDLLCIRCSNQIYTDPADWEYLGRSVMALEKNYSAGQVLSSMLFGGADKGGKEKDDAADMYKAMSA